MTDHASASRRSVGMLLPEETFRRVFGQVDLQRLESHPALRLLADRPLRIDAQDAPLLSEVEILVTGWGSPVLDAALLDEMPALRAIAHSAGTVRTLVTDEVYRRGIAVSSSASVNAIPVAEFTVALIVLGAKRAFWAAQRLREGAAEIDLEGSWPAVGIRSRTVGIIGASSVGRLVIERLRAFDLDVVLADPTLTPAQARELGVALVLLPELMERSDIISLHAPLLPSTSRMIDRDLLRRMRPGTTFVNTARGELVDQDALADRLDDGDVTALLDVAEEEPLPLGSRLRTHPHAFLTPHIAGSVGTELGRLSAHAVDEVISFATTGTFAEEISASTFSLRA